MEEDHEDQSKRSLPDDAARSNRVPFLEVVPAPSKAPFFERLVELHSEHCSPYSTAHKNLCVLIGDLVDHCGPATVPRQTAGIGAVYDFHSEDAYFQKLHMSGDLIPGNDRYHAWIKSSKLEEIYKNPVHALQQGGRQLLREFGEGIVEGRARLEWTPEGGVTLDGHAPISLLDAFREHSTAGYKDAASLDEVMMLQQELGPAEMLTSPVKAEVDPDRATGSHTADGDNVSGPPESLPPVFCGGDSGDAKSEGESPTNEEGELAVVREVPAHGSVAGAMRRTAFFANADAMAASTGSHTADGRSLLRGLTGHFSRTLREGKARRSEQLSLQTAF